MNLLAEIREGLSISWDAILAHKLRSGLTTLGIIIGIVTVSLMAMAIEGLNQAFLTSISAIGTDVIFILKRPWFYEGPWWKIRNRREIYFTDARVFLRQANPRWTVDFEAMSVTTVKYRDRSASGVLLIGNLDSGAVVGGLNLREGRFLSAPEVDGARPVCVLGAELADNFFPHESPLGRKVRVAETSYEVVGVLEKRGKFLGLETLDNQIFIPITRFVTSAAYNPSITIKAKVGVGAQMEEAREELRGIMRRVRRLAPGDDDDFAIETQEAFIRTFNRMGAVIASAGLGITGLSLFVGGIGIMNIMFVSVAQRTREIGLRKAVGAKRRTILVQFLIEAATICLLGGLLGLAIAWSLSGVLAQFLPATMSWTILGLALAVSLVTGLAAGFFPAWRAARMNPVDALRSE